eukprot:1160223-Pelagomonas_calceolata.AAC.2
MHAGGLTPPSTAKPLHCTTPFQLPPMAPPLQSLTPPMMEDEDEVAGQDAEASAWDLPATQARMRRPALETCQPQGQRNIGVTEDRALRKAVLGKGPMEKGCDADEAADTGLCRMLKWGDADDAADAG